MKILFSILFFCVLMKIIHCVPGVSGLCQKYAFTKNLQFLPDHYETLTKKGTHEDLILTKFCNDRVKIVDFLVKAYF